MRVQLQVHVQLLSGGHAGEHVLHPLLMSDMQVAHADLESARRRLIAMVGERLRDAARALDHRALAAELRRPALESLSISVDLPDRRRRHTASLLVARTTIGDRSVHVLPALDDETFDLHSGEDLQRRVGEVLEAWLRRQGPEREERLEELGRTRRAWLETLEIELPVGDLQVDRDDRSVRGDLELEGAATLLNLMDPAWRLRPVEREDLLSELAGALESPRPRPVLLVGESLVGKTTILEEHVVREVERRGDAARRYFRLAPQRLLAGMAFVGAWEERWLAILAAAETSGHVLVLDDLPGLCRAGVTRDSHVSMAQVARPLLQRGRVRIVGEATPRELEVLRDRDRAFADCFRVIPVDPPPAAGALRMLLAHARHLEERHGVEIDRDAILATWRLKGRRDDARAMPGKATHALAEAARMAASPRVTVDDVYEVVARQSGLSLLLVDDRRPLPREEIIARLSSRIRGQPAAVAALADTVLIARTGLADPRRPLGCLLFCGPTGVGKTHASRVLAELLYGDRDRLLRVDMNEFADPYAVERLIGSPHAHEGILTGGIRRQPGAVVLLDEVEKAHPDVLDLLLQVLGEGRLSDGEGRTVSFASAIIVMTSNLGAGIASGGRGFARNGETAGADAEDAARGEIEGFFRPELANRIDVVIAFEKLGVPELEAMALERIDLVRQRSGLTRRRCLLEVEPALVERIVADARSADHGARALEHSVERLITAPLAARLTSAPPGSPSVLTLFLVAGEVQIDVAELVRAVPSMDSDDHVEGTSAGLTAALGRARDELERVAAAIETARPEGAVTVTALSHSELGYFAAREELTRLEQRLSRLGEQIDRVAAVLPGSRRRGPQVRAPLHVKLSRDEIESLWGDVLVGRDAWPRVDGILTAVRGREPLELLAMRAAEILRAARALEALHVGDGRGDGATAFRVVIRTRGELTADPAADPAPRRTLADLIRGLGGEEDGDAFVVEDPAADRLVAGLCGCVLWCPPGSSGVLLEVGVEGQARRASLPAVQLVLWPRGACLDLATGILAAESPSVGALMRLLRARTAGRRPSRREGEGAS